MKRIVSIVVLFMFMISLAGCASPPATAPTTTAAATTAAAPATTTTAATTTTTTTTAATTTQAATTTTAATTTQATTTAQTTTTTQAATTAPAPAQNPVMTHAEYIEAALESEVVVEVYIQDRQSWWDNKATFYAQDKDGGYFLYQIGCMEDEYKELTPGTKIRVSGFKTEWSGEVEIVDAAFEIIEGNFIATARDVTSLMGSDDLIKHMNEFVTFKGLTVDAAGQDDNGEDLAFLYKWNGTGEDGDDLYFNASSDDNAITFTVPRYLRGKDTEVYAAVKDLKVGDTIDIECFLYWYEGPNPHVVSVKAVN